LAQNDCLAADGIEYLGFLYAGLMISSDGTPKVLEFNCRFGDPETQPIMARLNSDLVELCQAAIDGELADKSIDWDPRAALGVVMAAGGYPSNYRKGDRISGLPNVIGIEGKVFHAGTAMRGDDVVTTGGRVLCVVGLGDTVAAARDAAYARVERISWDNVFFRRDIGHRAIAREE
jgi:phosphoribosylamine--glycine ligase